jgi:hypothetical protein
MLVDTISTHFERKICDYHRHHHRHSRRRPRGRRRRGRRRHQTSAGTQIETYNKIPKSMVISELGEDSLEKWQSEWDNTTKGQITKQIFPVI